jgi:hypothetical protein
MPHRSFRRKIAECPSDTPVEAAVAGRPSEGAEMDGRDLPVKLEFAQDEPDTGKGSMMPRSPLLCGRKVMEWFSRKTSIAGIQIPNWMVVLGVVIVILLVYEFMQQAQIPH